MKKLEFKGRYSNVLIKIVGKIDLAVKKSHKISMTLSDAIVDTLDVIMEKGEDLIPTENGWIAVFNSNKTAFYKAVVAVKKAKAKEAIKKLNIIRSAYNVLHRLGTIEKYTVLGIRTIFGKVYEKYINPLYSTICREYFNIIAK